MPSWKINLELPITLEKILKSLKAKEVAKAEFYIYKPPESPDRIIDWAVELSKVSTAR